MMMTGAGSRFRAALLKKMTDQDAARMMKMTSGRKCHVAMAMIAAREMIAA